MVGDAKAGDRKLSIDLLKIVMALCVITIHVNPLQDVPGRGVFFTGGLARVAVPVFFLINGYFFETIARRGGTLAYVRRLLILFGIWTLLYLPAWYRALAHPDPWLLARFVVMGWWHLWYLPGLALAAALASILRDLPLRWQIAAMVLSYMTGVGIVYGVALDLLHPSAPFFGDLTVLHRNGLFLGLPFLLGGMLTRRYRLETCFSQKALTVIVVASLGLVMFEGHLFQAAATAMANHDNLASLAIASPAMLLLALTFGRQTSSRSLGTYANGLFFVHVAFCVIGFRLTDWTHLQIFGMTVSGSLAVTWALIRTGLARHLL